MSHPTPPLTDKIRFANLLNEANYAFFAGEATRARDLLTAALLQVRNEIAGSQSCGS